MPYPYTPPEHLQGQTADAIHRRMLDSLPADIDKSEMQIPWDFTRPAAIEKAEFISFELNETIKLLFSLWAYGEWLDMHAQSDGLARREANKASGELVVMGKLGYAIPAGARFATPSNLAAGAVFETTEDAVLGGADPSTGMAYAKIPIAAAVGGRTGNVPPGTIMIPVKPPPDGEISYVSNPEATSGGADEETDDGLRERILAANRRGASYTGCDEDYERWAMDVPGVGGAVVDPEWDDPSLPEEFHWLDAQGRRRCAGAVRLFVVDDGGAPANEQILSAVFERIISPSDRKRRLAPIGAELTVSAPEPVYIDVEAAVTPRAGESMAAIEGRFRAKLGEYWLLAAADKEGRDPQSGAGDGYVKYVYIGAALADTAGVANYDHASLKVNGGAADVLIGLGAFPVTRAVILIEKP